MKRFALTAFTLYAAWNIAPHFFKGPDVTRTCVAEKVVMGHPTIPEMGASHITLNCEGAIQPAYKIPMAKRDLAEIFSETGVYKLVTNEGSLAHPREIISALEIEAPTRPNLARAPKPAKRLPEIQEPRFTITYACASFERAGLPFPAGTEARYPEGCNVYAELEADRREAQRIALAEATQSKWSDLQITVGAPTPAAPVKAPAKKQPAKKQEILPWQIAVTTEALPRPARAEKPKTLFDYIFN